MTAEEANYWEDYYIKLYNTLDPEFGYNLKNGGGNISQEGLLHISEG